MDQTQKRRNLIENAIIQATRLVDARRALTDLQAEYAHAGTFALADFNGDYAHLEPAIINALFGGAGVVDDLETAFADAATNEVLLKMRR